MKVAIVGIFWDGYYDIWEDFLELKNRYWKDCPYPMYIVNQTRELEFEKNYDVTVFHAGNDAEYSKKVQYALQQIKADYYLLVLEDFFFTKPISGAVLESNLTFMQKENIYYLRMPLNEFYGSFNGSKFKNYEKIINIEPTNEYTLSCQPSIWKADFLEKCIGTGNYNAWIFEGVYAKSAKAHTLEFLSNCKIDTSNTLGFVHGALQGKMIPDTIDIINAGGYKMKNTREMMSRDSYKRYERKERLKAKIPFFLQRIIKKIIKTNSVVEKYDPEIRQQILLMGLD